MPAAPTASRLRRWQRQPDRRPQQILDAAFQVFGSRGLHRATLDDVARQAGITKGTIYLYFPSKAALFTAMLRARVAAVIPALDAGGGRPAFSLQGRLAAVGRDLYRFFSSPAYLAMFRTVVSEVTQFPEVAAQVYRDGLLAANRQLAAVIQQAIRTGECRQVDTIIAARALVGMFLIFALSQRLLGGDRIYPIADDAVVKTVADIFLHGLLSRRDPDGGGRPGRGRRLSGLRRGPLKTTHRSRAARGSAGSGA